MSTKMDVEILNFIVQSGGKQLTAKQIEEGTRLGLTQTNHWLSKLREAIESGQSWTKGYTCKQVKNEITNLQQWVYSYKL